MDELFEDAPAVPVNTSEHCVRAALVAEDSKSMQLAIGSVLQAAGFSVTYAENGQEALKEFLRGDFALIITDINMPIMDGVGLIRQVAQITRSKKSLTRLIIITSDTRRETIARTIDAVKSSSGSLVMGYLAKPWRVPDLLHQLRSVFADDVAMIERLNHVKAELADDTEEKRDCSRVPMAITEMDDGLRIELNCDASIPITNETIHTYIQQIEEVLTGIEVTVFEFGLAAMATQKVDDVITFLLMLKGLIDKHGKTARFKKLPVAVRRELENRALTDILVF